ncbi:hypothetical protein BJX66DRAFT_112111 [Aspergillus keveii]|uniref:Uncharacterized protein n=1 Tax=Aspergillus keveii TaxID=714993 RepID=A0ABR4FKQ5_9EURO
MNAFAPRFFSPISHPSSCKSQNRMQDISREQVNRKPKRRRDPRLTDRIITMNAISPISTPPSDRLTARPLFQNPSATPTKHSGRATYTHPPCATEASTYPLYHTAIKLDRPLNLKLRPPKASTRGPGVVAIMEIVPVNDNPRALPHYPRTRPASLPTPAHAPVEPPQLPANYHPMNGVSHFA